MKSQNCPRGNSALKELLSAYREQLSIPSFSGVLELVHAMPGRIRLRIPRVCATGWPKPNFSDAVSPDLKESNRSPSMVVFNINGNLKGDEERYVFLGRDGYVGATAV